MKKYLLILAALFIPITKASAFCPICTIAAGMGVGLSRWLGIDDTITGTWLGGLLLAASFWTIDWLNKKNIHFLFRKILVFVLYYGLVVIPLYWIDVIGHPFNKLFGIDKLVVGVVIGSIVFWAAHVFYQFLKKKNGGHAHFPFERIVIPVASLIIISGIFYFLTK